MSSEAWLKTAKNQGYGYMIELTENKTGMRMAIFTKTLEERREKVLKLQDTGLLFGKVRVHVSGVFKVSDA